MASRAVGRGWCWLAVWASVAASSVMNDARGARAAEGAPEFEWAIVAGGPEHDKTRGLTVDSTGHLLLTGEFTGTAKFGDFTVASAGSMDFFVAKVDPQGKFVWVRTGGGAKIDRGYAVATDSTGAVYVTGHFESPTATFDGRTIESGGDYDLFVAKYDASGTLAWIRAGGGAGYDYGHGVAASEGRVYVTGAVAGGVVRFNSQPLGAAGPARLFCLALDADGRWVWSRTASGAGSSSGHAAAVDRQGRCIVGGFASGAGEFGGRTFGEPGKQDLFVARLDPLGELQWLHAGHGSSAAMVHELTVDDEGSVWACGMWKGELRLGDRQVESRGEQDLLLTRFDPDGKRLWTRTAGGSAIDYGLGVAVDERGAGFLTGSFHGTVDFAGVELTSGPGGSDIPVVKFDRDGRPQWAVRAGSERTDHAYTIVSDRRGGLYLSGACSGAARFGARSLDHRGSNDIFLAKLQDAPPAVPAPPVPDKSTDVERKTAEPATQSPPAGRPLEPLDVGSRRELFVDDRLIERLTNARRQLHAPVARELAIVHDAAWEGPGSAYHTVIRDGDLYRLYYRGSTLRVQDGKLVTGPESYCYAESRDGIAFSKPELGLFEHDGSKRNNIIWKGVGAHNFAPFLDARPDCPPASRFKALGGLAEEGGLFAFHSPDGIRWSLIQEKPVVTVGAFDSQNLAFWDSIRGVYRAYFRTFTAGVTTGKVWKPEGYRAIRTAVSRDFLKWEEEADLQYVDSPAEHLYTNQISPYFRAPQLLIGFPARYVERGWSESMRALPERTNREQRAAAHLRYGTAITEGLLMASRDGVRFERWNEAFLRPGPERTGSWLYGHQFIASNTVETKSSLPGAPPELSLYALEGSWHGPGNALRRYTLRMDGFVSVNAPLAGGELLTKPLKFSGRRLTLNFASSAAGDLRVEVQDESGEPLPGLALDDCEPTFGDALDRPVVWKSGADLSAAAGRTIRLRFVLRDADLYALRFVE